MCVGCVSVWHAHLCMWCVYVCVSVCGMFMSVMYLCVRLCPYQSAGRAPLTASSNNCLKLSERSPHHGSLTHC